MGLKNKKLQKGKKNSLSGAAATGAGEDRVTNLPDCLIHHILSFLQLKYIVRTSVLSKRWNCIFASIPVIDFWGLEEMRPKMFMDIVDRILHLHDMSKIQELCLEYYDHLKPSKVNLWIYAAIKRNVEKFDFKWVQEVGEPFHMPLSLFTCESLITLKLDICTRMYLPKYISCLRLKHLQLRGVDFSDEYNTEQLFSNCPVLEELMLEDCDWSRMTNFCISAPALKILKILGVDVCCRWAHSYKLRGCALKINAPNLVSLSYKFDLAKEYVASSFQKLVDVDLDFDFDKRVEDATRRVYMLGLGATTSRFFQALSHVKCLSISDRVLRVMSCAEDLKNHLPKFHHLKQLKVEREANTDETLIALLKSSPNLESLVLNEFIPLSRRLGIKTQNLEGRGDNEDGNHENDWDLDIMTTGCLLLQLKSVSFEAFSGRPREMSWVKLILRNAKDLQTMNVSYAPCSHYLNLTSKEEFMEEVPDLPTASENLTCYVSDIECLH